MNLSLWLDKDVDGAVAKLAAKLGMPKSSLVEVFVLRGLVSEGVLKGPDLSVLVQHFRLSKPAIVEAIRLNAEPA